MLVSFWWWFGLVFLMLRCAFAFLFVLIGSLSGAADIAFQSPSGNIRCDMSRDTLLSVRCELGVDQQSYTNRPTSCEGDWGTSFGLRQTGTGLVVCATDAVPAPEDRPVLPYGRRAILDGITCRSERSGVTCTNIEGGGFEVRRAEQRIF